MLQQVMIPLEELRQDAQNVRAHGDKNLSSIAGSLRQFGQVEPLVVQKSTKVVIGGNGRLEAMQRLGWTQAACVLVDLDGLHARALGLALNRTAELAEWDTHKLEGLIGELATDSFDLDAIGFDDDDVAKLLRERGESDDDDNKDEPKIGSQYMVLVVCGSEAEQADMLERFTDEGLECKALVS